MEFIAQLVAQYVAPYAPMIEIVAETLGYLVLIATTMARFPGLNKFAEHAGKAGQYWLMLIRFLPTLGVNPQTKRLEEQLEAKK